MRCFITLAILFSISGCNFSKVSTSSVSDETLPSEKIIPRSMKVTIQALDDANENTPVAVDVVYTLSQELAQKLSTMSAKEYFKMRDQLIRDYINLVMIHGWEIPPGHTVKEEMNALHPQTQAAFLFADYDVPGVHRSKLPVFENLYVHLKRADFKIMTV